MASGHTFKGQIPASIAGVGFFDYGHNQLGVAKNAIELHPILSAQFGQAAKVPASEQSVPSASLHGTPNSD